MASEVSGLETNLKDAKLFQVSDVATVLWDHRCVGDHSKLQFTILQKPRVNIKESVLQEAVHFLESTPEREALYNFVGSFKYAEGSSAGIILNLKKFRENFIYPGIKNVSVPVLISKKHKEHLKRESSAYLKDLQMLYERCQNQACINANDFFSWYITCSVLGTVCNLKIELMSLSATFTLTPLHMLPIIASEVTEFLSKSKGDTIHTGFVTIEFQKKLILVPEDLESLPVLPLVGIWISGVHSIHHPLVWISCVRYICSSFYQKRLCLPPQPFLLILYQPKQELPEFYDCTGNNGKLFPKYDLYEGETSICLPKVPIYDARSLSVELEERKDRPKEFEAAVEKIEPHVIVPVYPNIVTNLEDKFPRPFPPTCFKEIDLEGKLQPLVPELSIDDFSDFVTPVISQSSNFPIDCQIKNFNKPGCNSNFPTKVANENDCVPVLNAHKFIENRTASAPLQFMNTCQENMMTKNWTEQQPRFSHPESSYRPGNLNKQLTFNANFNEGSPIDQNTSYCSPVIVNHNKHSPGMFYSDELKLPTHINYSKLPTYSHNVTRIQQPSNFHRNRPNIRVDDYCVDQWHYQNRNLPLASHMQDHQQNVYPNANDQTSLKQLNGVRYSQDCLQNCSKQTRFSSRKAFSEGSILQCANDSLSEWPGLCSNGEANIHINASRRRPDMHSSMDKKDQFEFPDMHPNNYSDPLFADDDYHLSVAPKITSSTQNTHTSTASNINPSTTQQPSSSPIPPNTTSFENSLIDSNKSIAQNVSTAMPKKSCLKKTQSPKFSSFDFENPSLQSNSPSVTWKNTSESVKRTARSSITIASEKNSNCSKIIANNRSINKSIEKTQKQDLTQNNEKPLKKKTEIISRQSSKIAVKQSCSRSGKTVTKTSVKSLSHQQHHAASKEGNSTARSTVITTTDEACVEVEPSKSEEVMQNKECLPFSDSTASKALTFDTTQETNNSSVTLCNEIRQSLKKQEMTLTENLKEFSRKMDETFEGLTNRILLNLHQINDKSPNSKLEDQIIEQSVNSKIECHVTPQRTKHSTPNCSDPKSLPQISMSAVNTPSVKKSPIFCSNDCVVSRQTVTVIKETRTVSTMTSFVIEHRSNTETPTKLQSHPISEQDEKMPVNTVIEKQAAVPSRLPTKMCTCNPLILKNKNVLNAKRHVSDSDISKIQQRMDCDKTTQNCHDHQCSCNPKISSAQQIIDDDLPVKLGKNNDKFIQEGDKTKKNQGLQNTLDYMEYMFKVNRHSLPNRSSGNVQKQSKMRLSDSGNLQRKPKPKDSKENAKPFKTKLPCASPKASFPCKNKNGEIKLQREIGESKKDSHDSTLQEDSSSDINSLPAGYPFSFDDVSFATKKYVDRYQIFEDEKSLSDISES